jgi:hypothetical protein
MCSVPVPFPEGERQARALEFWSSLTLCLPSPAPGEPQTGGQASREWGGGLKLCWEGLEDQCGV